MFNELDPVLHSQLRLALMSLLISVKDAEFNFLKEKTGATAGNLSVQLTKLTEAGYITMNKTFRGKYPLTICAITPQGVTAMEKYVGVIGSDPWYAPQYAIPLLGMILGNTMNGIALGLDRLTQDAAQKRQIIETRLALGQNWKQAISDCRREAIRVGMIPIINAMSAAGVISLPGMMTGQILAGTPPVEAVKYQILVMFLIAGGTGFGTVVAVSLAARRLFDERQRLRLDRLALPRN